MACLYRRLSRLLLVLPFLWVTTTQAAEKGEEPVAAIEFEATFVALGVGYRWGNGKLWFKGKKYTFSVSAATWFGIGAATVRAKGGVLHLNDLADFSGTYRAFSVGGALGIGGGGLTMKNEKGVVINLGAVLKGVKLSIGVSKFTIKLEK